MYYLIYGEDSYRSRLKKQELVESLKKNNEVFYFDASLSDISYEIEKYLKGQSLFSETPLLVIAYPVSGREENVAFFASNAERMQRSPITCVLWDTSSGAPQKDRVRGTKTGKKKKATNTNVTLRLIENAEKVFDFPYLQNSALKKYVHDHAHEKNASLSDQELSELIENYGGDLWAISGELDKKALTGSFFYEQRKRVAEKLFDFTDALAEGNRGSAFTFFTEIQNAGFDEVYILGSLAGMVRTMIKIKSILPQNPDYRKLEEFGLHPFVLKKTLSHIRRFRLEDLKKLYQKILRADVSLKTEGHDPFSVLTLLVSEF